MTNEAKRAELARRKALLATATLEGTRGQTFGADGDPSQSYELAVLCQDCRRQMLVIHTPAHQKSHAVWCITCGAKRFMK